MLISRAMKIQDAPHGINVVVEMLGPRVYIGRFDSVNGFQALLHDCDVHDLKPGDDKERYIREAATYGIDVQQRDATVDVMQIARVRLLGEIEKLA
jgi:hypothetical protein